MLLAVPEARGGDVRKPDGTPLPPTEGLEVQQQVGDPLIRVVYAGLKARELPAPPGPDNPETGDPIEYAAEYFSAMDFEPPNGGGKYYLLVRARRVGEKYVAIRAFGWVHSKYLLTTTHAPGRPGDQAIPEGDGGQFARRHRRGPEALQGQPGARFGALSPRTAPTKDGPPADEDIRLFSLFFVYARADHYVLLGRSLNFDPTKEEPRNVLVGWLPAERICDWPTREAVYWSPAPPRSTPGLVFKTPEDAIASLRGDPVPTVTSELPAVQGGDVYGRRPTPIQMRFPVLDWDRPDVPQRMRNNTLLRIGAIGDFAAGPDGLRNRITEEDLARMLAQLAAIKREAKRVELVFLIDETESMKAWLPVVAKTIEAIISRVRETAVRRNGAEVWIAIGYYGDTFGGTEAATPAPLIPAASPDLERALRGVSDHAPTPDGDVPERVFHGLGQAIQGARFSKYARKMVFLFGDMGNKASTGIRRSTNSSTCSCGPTSPSPGRSNSTRSSSAWPMAMWGANPSRGT